MIEPKPRISREVWVSIAATACLVLFVAWREQRQVKLERAREIQQQKAADEVNRQAIAEIKENCEKARTVDREHGDHSENCAACSGKGTRLNCQNAVIDCFCCNGRGRH